MAVVTLAACGRAGLPFDGGASSEFSSVGSPVSQGDAEAQALLLDVASGAMVIALDEGGGGYDGLTAAQVSALDPSMHVVGDVPAKIGVVSLNHSGPEGAVLSTKSTSGRVFCVALTEQQPMPKTGSVDAHGATSVHDCTGKRWSLGF